MKNATALLENLIRWFAYTVLTMTVFVILVAIFYGDKAHEANIGSFENRPFNTGWVLECDGTTSEISLPADIDTTLGEKLTITNTLPKSISNNTSLFTRSSLADIRIYVNGYLKQEYTTGTIPHMAYYIPSAYIVTELSGGDSGKEVKIEITPKASGHINGVWLTSGNNGWFDVLYRNIPVTLLTILVLTLGIILFIFHLLTGRTHFGSRASLYLSLVMITVALWGISESDLRQLMFARPSLSAYFSYSSVELIGVLVCMYFDEVQHRKHHVFYLVIEIMSSVVLAINFILHFNGTLELFRSLIFAHIVMAAGLLLITISCIKDIFIGNIKEYKFTAIGILIFLAMAGCELVGFYISRMHEFGLFVCLGLIALMITTLTQVLVDQLTITEQRQKRQNQMIVNTIETIAGAIDASDEYTGGHSERVGRYAEILARAIAADYDFTEDDIKRIHYIGKLHDIGKIGVADNVLNNPGRLSDIEFGLLKKHVVIGADLVSGLDESVEGLTDGIKYHHERFDGKGYPEGLSSIDIPLVARILCIADSYDAMTSNRIYRNRLSDEAVRNEIIRCSGTQFDPALTEAFVRLIDTGEIYPLTINGRDVEKSESSYKSVQLEIYLQNLVFDTNKKINNPSHVRMLCYVMKLVEKNKENVDVLFVKMMGDCKKTASFITAHLKTQDLFIDCYEDVYLVALFNRRPDDVESFISTIDASECGKVVKRI